MRLHSKYLSSDAADILARFKLGKTLFGTQLFKCGISDNPYCATCIRELDEEIPENITHATYECEFVATIVVELHNIFFPQTNNAFNIGEVLLAITEDKHPLYTGKTGQLLASLIWDFFLKYIMTCHNKKITPIAVTCIHEVKSQINRILKILPFSDLTKHILASNTLSDMFKIYD